MIISFTFRFNVRDFSYNAEELEAGKNEIKKLDADKKKQFVSLIFITDVLNKQNR